MIQPLLKKNIFRKKSERYCNFADLKMFLYPLALEVLDMTPVAISSLQM